MASSMAALTAARFFTMEGICLTQRKTSPRFSVNCAIRSALASNASSLLMMVSIEIFASASSSCAATKAEIL